MSKKSWAELTAEERGAVEDGIEPEPYDYGVEELESEPVVMDSEEYNSIHPGGITLDHAALSRP